MSTLIFGDGTSWYRLKPGLFDIPQHALGIGIRSTADVKDVLIDMGFQQSPTSAFRHEIATAERLEVIVAGRTVTLLNELEGNLVPIGECDFKEPAAAWNAAISQQTHVVVCVAPVDVFTKDFPDTVEEFKQLLSTVYLAAVPVTTAAAQAADA